jgi:SOS-response transcriptional repressor LexA
MPALAPIGTHAARYSVLEADLPGRGAAVLGVLLEDPARDELHLRLRRDLDSLAEGDDLDVLEALADDLAGKARELGAARLFAWLEENLSGTLRVGDREPVLVDGFDRALNRLYRRHVAAEVRPFETHLPKYTLRAAAGRFLENAETREEGWEEAPENLRRALYRDMFVAHVAGHSMEPRIPDGSLCVFRAAPGGSRSGRLVLVEDRAAHAFSIKRYESEKSGEGEEWRHRRIRLESLNPEYPSWDLEPEEDKYRIVAEFVGVLE